MSYPQVHCIRDTDHGRYTLLLSFVCPPKSNISFKGDLTLTTVNAQGYTVEINIYEDLEFYSYADAKDWLNGQVFVKGII